MSPGELAVALFAELPPSSGSKAPRADQFALVLWLDGRAAATIGEVRDAFGIPQTRARDLVRRAEASGLVELSIDAGDRRRTLVVLSGPARRLRSRARGNN